MANVIYNSFKKRIMDGSIDLDTDTIKVGLVTDTYTPNQDTHEFYSDITNEVVGTGYTAGGKTLTVTLSQDNTDNEGVFDAADVTWTTATITARGAFIYKDTGTASTSPLICLIDFTVDKTSTEDDFLVTWNAEGILNLN